MHGQLLVLFLPGSSLPAACPALLEGGGEGAMGAGAVDWNWLTSSQEGAELTGAVQTDEMVPGPSQLGASVILELVFN